MPAPRAVVGEGTAVRLRDEESGHACDLDEDSPTSRKPLRGEGRFPLTRWELAAASSVFLLFSAGLFSIYITLPKAQYREAFRLPRTIADLRVLKNHFAVYAKDYQTNFMLGYCSTYIFMQTFMIPGTIFMSLLAGALFGVIKGVILVVFTATSGASSCYFLSKLIGRPLISWIWPEKLRLFQAEVAKRREKLLNYMLFLRITPSLPNTFINVASPIVDIPFHIFFLATLVGLVPSSYITVRVVVALFVVSYDARLIPSLLARMLHSERSSLDVSSYHIRSKAGLALGDLRSVRDLYDLKTFIVLFLIGFVSILPTILKRKRTYE